MKILLQRIKDFTIKDNFNFVKIFLLSFAVILTLLTISNIILDSLGMIAIYDADSVRVYGDMSIREYNHYRTSAHPLFVISTQPIVYILSKFFGTFISAMLLQALAGAVSITAFYLLIKKIFPDNKKLQFFLLLIFCLSFPQLIYNSVFETYPFAQAGLILMWLSAVYLLDKKISLWKYVIICILGVISISVTITNFLQFIVFVSVVILLNKSEKQKFLKVSSVLMVTVSIAVLLAQIQNIIWPSAPNFFESNIKGFFLEKNTEEFIYLNRNPGWSDVVSQIKASTLYNFSILGDYSTRFFYFNDSVEIVNISIIIFIIFAILNIKFILRDKKILFKAHKLYLGLLAVYIINFILHIFYYPGGSYLFILNYYYALVIINAYSIYYLFKDRKASSIRHGLLVVALVIYSMLQIIGVLRFFEAIKNLVGFHKPMPLKLNFLISTCLALAVLLFFRDKKVLKKYKSLSIVMRIGIILFVSSFTIAGISLINQLLVSKTIKYELGINQSFIKLAQEKGYTKIQDLLKSFSKYSKEVNDTIRKDNFPLLDYDITMKGKANFLFFGMADRRKLVYYDGKLVDIFSKEVIREWNIKESMIIPNMYSVILIDKNDNLIRIFEDESGIFIIENEKALANIVLGKEKINLSNFEGHKYQNILKVLHQEILFNIHEGIPKSNIITYSSDKGNYKNAMLVALVLEYSNNTHLLEKWVSSIKDTSGDPAVIQKLGVLSEQGHLLNILSIVKNNKKHLVDKIKKEIKDFQENDQKIPYYSASLILLSETKKYGTRVNNLYLPIDLDENASLAWWAKRLNPQFGQSIKDKKRPYLEWASSHSEYNHHGSVHILDEYYPLTYEGKTQESDISLQEFFNKYYSTNENPEGEISLSHSLHASEMFLLLSNINETSQLRY